MILMVLGPSKSCSLGPWTLRLCNLELQLRVPTSLGLNLNLSLLDRMLYGKSVYVLVTAAMCTVGHESVMMELAGDVVQSCFIPFKS